MFDSGEKTLKQIISGSIMFNQNQKHYGTMFKIIVNKIFYRQLRENRQCKAILIFFSIKILSPLMNWHSRA